MDGQVEQEEPKEKEELRAALQTEWRSAETRQSPRDEDVQEEEVLSFTHKDTGGCLLRREERDRDEDNEMEEEEEEEEDHMMPDKVGFLLLLPLLLSSGFYVCFCLLSQPKGDVCQMVDKWRSIVHHLRLLQKMLQTTIHKAMKLVVDIYNFFLANTLVHGKVS